MPLTSTRTPAIDEHAIRPPHAPSRSAARARIALVVVVGALGAGAVRAESTTIDEPARAASTADRFRSSANGLGDVVLTGEGLLFPIDPSPRCEVLNNFGGHSKSGQAGGHQGVDIGADLGQEVYAVEDGVLTEQIDGDTAGLGWKLLAESGVQYRYYHLDGFAPGLAEGDAVEAGQLIGYVGDSRGTGRRRRSTRCRCSPSRPAATCIDGRGDAQPSPRLSCLSAVSMPSALATTSELSGSGGRSTICRT